MPYLFSKAVQVHNQGIPMMRAMMLEFPEDSNCNYLDRQYMLGESLLVAPVFCEDGIVKYYVPEGIWTNWITKEKLEGGRWYKQRFDYFSLPLLVRPNTLLAVGQREDTADYEFQKDVTFHLFELGEGKSAKAEVYSRELDMEIEITAERSNDRVYVTASADTGWKLCDSKGQICLIPEIGCKDYTIQAC